MNLKDEEHLLREAMKRQNPDDRVLPFEAVNEHGVYCYDTEKRLVWERMTPRERQEHEREMARLGFSHKHND